MTTENRFALEGFTRTSIADTSTHDVDIGTISDGGFTFLLEMLRRNDLTSLSYLVASVKSIGGKTLWTFRSSGIDGIAIMALAGTTPVIAIIEPGTQGKLCKVIPLVSLKASKPTDLRTLFELKQLAGAYLGREIELNTLELKLASINLIDPYARERAAREAAERLAQQRLKEQQAQFERRQAAKQARIAALMARPSITVYTPQGKTFVGRPVTNDEWESLPSGTKVVLVGFYEQGGTVGNVIEAFQVKKEQGRNPHKLWATPVTIEEPLRAIASATAGPVGTTMIEARDGAILEVTLFDSMDSIREAGIKGLNSGSLVAVQQPTSQKLAVFSMDHGKPHSMGNYVPLL